MKFFRVWRLHDIVNSLTVRGIDGILLAPRRLKIRTETKKLQYFSLVSSLVLIPVQRNHILRRVK